MLQNAGAIGMQRSELAVCFTVHPLAVLGTLFMPYQNYKIIFFVCFILEFSLSFL